jgi:hypothetical protein
LTPDPRSPLLTDARRVARLLRADINQRAEIGLTKALLGLVFEPENPFDRLRRRQPSKMAILVVLVLLAALFCLFYFNVPAR